MSKADRIDNRQSYSKRRIPFQKERDAPFVYRCMDTKESKVSADLDEVHAQHRAEVMDLLFRDAEREDRVVAAASMDPLRRTLLEAVSASALRHSTG